MIQHIENHKIPAEVDADKHIIKLEEFDLHNDRVVLRDSKNSWDSYCPIIVNKDWTFEVSNEINVFGGRELDPTKYNVKATRKLRWVSTDHNVYPSDIKFLEGVSTKMLMAHTPGIDNVINADAMRIAYDMTMRASEHPFDVNGRINCENIAIEGTKYGGSHYINTRKKDVLDSTNCPVIDALASLVKANLGKNIIANLQSDGPFSQLKLDDNNKLIFIPLNTDRATSAFKACK